MQLNNEKGHNGDTYDYNYHAVRGEREEPIQTWTSRQKDFEIVPK